MSRPPSIVAPGMPGDMMSVPELAPGGALRSLPASAGSRASACPTPVGGRQTRERDPWSVQDAAPRQPRRAPADRARGRCWRSSTRPRIPPTHLSKRAPPKAVELAFTTIRIRVIPGQIDSASPNSNELETARTGSGTKGRRFDSRRGRKEKSQVRPWFRVPERRCHPQIVTDVLRRSCPRCRET
jgi:hypothetical protein